MVVAKQLWLLLFTSVITVTAQRTILDLNSVGGQLGFIGDYAGLSPYQQPSQLASLNNTIVMSSMNDNTLIFQPFATLNNGSVTTWCQLSDSQYILAGQFNTINSTAYNHIAQLDTSSMTLSALLQGLDGPVRTVYCTNNSVYVGGDFIAPVNNSNSSNYRGHVALWENGQWNPLPWKGFNGAVNSIVAQPHQQSILFAGAFDATGDGQYANPNDTFSNVINLASSATVTGGNSAFDTNPSGVICGQSPWLLQDDVPGYWEAQFNSPITPSKFRLANVHTDNRGTNEFNIIALGSNEYFELQYTDPETNQMTTCTTSCYLSNITSIVYQDFTVINNSSSVTGIRININTWFGTGGGLSNVDIFRSDVSLQPQFSSSNSTSSCSSNTTPMSSATTTGNWTQVYSYSNYQNYLVATFPSTELLTSTVSVNYQPYIATQGNYNVYITTPGCVGTSTCDQRTQVALYINLTPNNASNYYLDQQNTADQRTLIYTGPISTTTSAFQPSIVMRVATNATAPTSSTVAIMADSIEFIRNSTNGTALAGILNYYPSNNTYIPLPQQLPASAIVNTLHASDNKLYIGGMFNGTNYTNMVSFDFGTSSLVSIGSINGPVSASVLSGNQLFVGGSFNQSNNIAVYDTQANTWSALDSGTNGPVTSLFIADDTVHASGTFTVAGNQPAFNNAQWSTVNHNWVPPTSLIIGPISNQISINGNTLYLGSIKGAQSYRADNVATINSKNQWQSSITWIDPSAVIISGVFYEGKPILAGQFHFNNTLYHIAMYDGSSWYGLLLNIQGQVNTLLIYQNLLLIGGQFSTTSNSASLTVYDLQNQVYKDVQGLYTGNQPGQVNVIRPIPNSNAVYVAGNFTLAGLLNCNSICQLALDTFQWSQINQGISGNVEDMVVASSVTVVGQLNVNGASTGLAVLDNTNTAHWRSGNNAPASLNSILNDDNGSLIVASNQGYMANWNGTALTPLDAKLGSTSTVNQLLYVSVDSSSSSSRFPSNTNSMLLALGNLHLLNANAPCSAALYDGSSWSPYLLTSTSTGQPGTLHTSFTVTDCCTLQPAHHYLSIPAVILVSIAISCGILFFLVALSFLYLLFKRRNHVKHYQDPVQEWKPKYRPQSFLAMLDAANLNDSAILSAAATGPTAGYMNNRDSDTTGYSSALRGASIDMTNRILPFSALLTAALNNNNEEASETNPKVYYAKYPFEAKEFGELALDAQQPIVVTDTSDNVWWMGYKDDGSNQPVSGLFPSNYVTRTKPF